MDNGIAFTLGMLTIRWYGILIALAFSLGSYLAHREALRQKLSPDDLMNLLLVIIPCSIIGARLYYVIMRWDYYGLYPQYILRTWEGGMAVHGGIIACVLGLILYCRSRGQNTLRWADLFMPSLALGQAIGRWGNFFNQEAYGYETTVPWAMFIDGAYRHPTFLYESLWNLLLFGLLLYLLRRPHRLGSIFATYLICYSVGRFFIESLRTDSLMLGDLRMAMVISVLGILLGCLILYMIRRRPKVDVTVEQSGVPRQVRRAAQRTENKKR